MTSRIIIQTCLVLVGVLILVSGIYAAVLFIAHDYNGDFLKIDDCLDSGGAWDYGARNCKK
jgi:hypothetical protein